MGLAKGCVHVLYRRAGGGRLGGVLLGSAQLGDRGRQRGEVRQQRCRGQGGVAAEVTGHGQQPCSDAQAVPVMAAAGDSAITGAGSAIVGVGCAAQDRACRALSHMIDSASLDRARSRDIPGLRISCSVSDGCA
jgi:hypothetical protein